MRESYSAIRHPNKKEVIRSGRYVAPLEKRNRGTFRQDAQQGQPFLPNERKHFQWAWEYETKSSGQDLIVGSYPYFSGLLNLSKISDWHHYAFFSPRLNAGFADIMHYYGGKLSQAETAADK